MKRQFDVFWALTPEGEPGPFLVVPYGARGPLPGSPAPDGWRYLATLRSDLDAVARIGARTIDEARHHGYSLTWRSPV